MQKALALSGNYDEFSDAACTSAIHTSHWTGTSTIPGTTASGETKIDIAYATFTSTPLTADNATNNNNYSYCGVTDWASGVEKDILGAPCQGFAIPVGGESLDIYKITSDSLLFGTNAPIGMDLTEDARPTTFNELTVFTRQCMPERRAFCSDVTGAVPLVRGAVPLHDTPTISVRRNASAFVCSFTTRQQ
ncbi:MAG: hypothetical protein FJ137_07060 [Deltaproteobacteria bacterium]|nr:hypothetical protein [Deltaproteobacteria bacterium]